MKASPVLSAIRNAIRPTTFENWCALKGIKPMPVLPAIVANFVDECADLGLSEVLAIVANISAAHSKAGLADPTLGDPVAASVNAVSGIKPPRSWPKAEWAVFFSLPYQTQTYLVTRDNDQTKIVRVAQNKAAEAAQETAKLKAELETLKAKVTQ